MKTWHWIAIGGVVLVGAYFLLRGPGSSGATPVDGTKLGTGINDAGAPPLPNIALSNFLTAGKLTFTAPPSVRTGIAALGADTPTPRTTQTLGSGGNKFFDLLKG